MKYTPLLLAVMAIGLLTACGADDGASPTPTTSSAQQTPTVAPPTGPTPTRTPVSVPITRELTVFAASSLTGAFTQIGEDYGASNPGIGVRFNFAGSQELRTQLANGAEADVFASADASQMDAAAASGLVAGIRRPFAHNRLVIIVPKANEADVQSPQDLAKPGIKIIVGGDNVPVGRYTGQFLDDASSDVSFGAGYKDAVLANVVSQASNVKEIVSAVQLDEVDAGIVYITDVSDDISNDVTTVEIPDALNPIAEYVIATTYTGFADQVAIDFVEYVASGQGQETLAAFGFTKVDQ